MAAEQTKIAPGRRLGVLTLDPESEGGVQRYRLEQLSNLIKTPSILPNLRLRAERVPRPW